MMKDSEEMTQFNLRGAMLREDTGFASLINRAVIEGKSF